MFVNNIRILYTQQIFTHETLLLFKLDLYLTENYYKYNYYYGHIKYIT